MAIGQVLDADERCVGCEDEVAQGGGREVGVARGEQRDGGAPQRRLAHRGRGSLGGDMARRDAGSSWLGAQTMAEAMVRSDLLSIDDALLRAGWTLGLLWLAGSAIWIAVSLSDPVGSIRGIGLVLACASAPLGLLAAGFRLRRRERRAWALRRLIDEHVEIRAADLLASSDFTAATLDRAIRDLNNAGGAFLVWDRHSDWIQDGRLRQLRVQVEECSSCRAKISTSVAIGASEPARCPYCGDPLAVDRLLEEKARVIDELHGERGGRALRPAEKGSFSIPLFALLAAVCWPLAIVYALWQWRTSQPD